MKEITTIWHEATESPGKRPIYLLCKHGKTRHLSARSIQFLSSGIIPADCQFHLDGKLRQPLPVAWAYADDITKEIPKRFIAHAKMQAVWYKVTDEEEAEANDMDLENMTSQELSDIVRAWVKADEHRTILFCASNGKEYTTDVLINNKGEFTSYLIDLAKKSEDVRKEIIDAARILENENHAENNE